MTGMFSSKKVVLLSLSLAALTGCSSLSNLIGDGDPIDYRSPNQRSVKRNPLEVPPNILSLPTTNNTYNHAPITANDYNQAANSPNTNTPAVTAPTFTNMRVHKDSNNVRWLEIDSTDVASLMPKLRGFWEDHGFIVTNFSVAEGIVETDWAENRAKLPQDFLRSIIGSVLDSVYSTGELDKFRSRIESNKNGGVDVYITHQGKEEVLVGSDKTQTRWVNRPNDPELEAIFLRRFMQSLGAPKEAAQASIDQPIAPINQAVKLTDNASALDIAEPLDRAWRRVSLGLDRGGFTVGDYNRAAWTFFVRFMGDPAEKGEVGFWGSLFGTSDPEPIDLEIRLSSISENQTRVQVYQAGKVVNTSEAQKVLQLLQKQL